MQVGQGRGEYLRVPRGALYVFALPVHTAAGVSGAIAVFHEAVSAGTPVWRRALVSAAQAVLIVGVTLLIIRWNFRQPLQHIAQRLRDLRTGRIPASAALATAGTFPPLEREVTQIATSLNAARAAAEEEARLRDAALAFWTPERLRISMQGKLNGSRLFAVSNREPYEHTRQGSSTSWSVPPSGLVTALEPVLKACDGTWIGQATGKADREAADANGRLRVPHDHPKYTLRRVWLSGEEEQGFYFGFANEGLWPLCHVAHTRPIFRAGDWQYRAGPCR